jgi:hypothetical protein
VTEPNQPLRSEAELERAAEAWIADHRAVRHLTRTRDWLLRLDPSAGLAARIAALTHDVERGVPGGPEFDPAGDPEYLRAHCERSARLVADWLAEQGVEPALREDVAALVSAHETGGSEAANLVQAADSLSFLELNPPRVIGWVREGRCDRDVAQAKLDWMRDRIQVAAARRLSEPLHARASAALEAQYPRDGSPAAR